MMHCGCYRDRFRTVINVLGDAYGAGIVEKLSEAELGRKPSSLTAAELETHHASSGVPQDEGCEKPNQPSEGLTVTRGDEGQFTSHF